MYLMKAGHQKTWLRRGEPTSHSVKRHTAKTQPISPTELLAHAPVQDHLE